MFQKFGAYCICSLYLEHQTDKNKKMKLVRHTNESTSYGKKSEIICNVANNQEAFDKVAQLEDQNWFPQSDGKIFDVDSNEVYDPKYPTQFDFVDFHYTVEND